MKTKYSITLGVVAALVLALLGVLTFAAGGIVGRHHVTPLVGLVDAAEAGVKKVMKSMEGKAEGEEYSTSAYYHLKTTRFQTSDTGEGDNIGFAPLANGYLVGQRAGGLKFVAFEEDGVAVRELATELPTNKEQFLQDTQGMNERLHIQFGVKDIFIQPQGDQFRLFSSHHYWHAEDRCWTMRLSMLETTADDILGDGAAEAEWQTVYDTEPCAELTSQANHNNEDNTFLHSGGRLILLDDSHLLMGVGDHFWDGQHNENLVQDPNASYGKVMLVDLEARSASMFTMGHRNPQGLYVDQQGNVWAAEQGPRGGDEINLLEQGNNYGWPLVSYGTDYAGVSWPEQFDWASHGGDFQKPIWSWVPSIASNNIIRLEGSNFPLWEGDLMVTSLKDQSIHRMMIAEGRVIASERIHIGNRIRDLTQTESGNILLLADDGQLVHIEPVVEDGGDQMPAELRASQLWVQCDSCHTVDASGEHSAGPNLHGVVGSDIARFDDYSYTPALREVEGNWTPERLDGFLRDPQEFAPGTAMAFPGMEDPEDRQILIEYLQQQSR